MLETSAGLTPLHMAVLAGDHAALESLLPDKSALSAKTTAMLTSVAQGADRRVFRPGSATFYPPDPVDFIGEDRAFDKGSNPLHLAASIGDLRATEVLLAHRARPKTRDGIGATPLHLAAIGGHGAVVERLLSEKVDVNAATKTRKSIRFLDAGTTPLMAALASGVPGVVAALMAHGADPHARTKAGIGVIEFAARGGSVACLNAMVDAGVAVDDEPAHMNFPLRTAAERGHVDLALRLLALGAPSETPRGHQGPLRAAIANDDRVMRQALLDAGVRPLPDHGVESAIRSNDYIYLRDWLAAGNDPDDGGKGSHLWLAAAQGKMALVELLLEHGADVNAHRGRGTPVHVALQNSHLAVAARLLDAHPDCSIADEHGNEPLMHAVFGRGDRTEIVARLLACGANPHSVGRGGQSVIDAIDRVANPAIVALLEGVGPQGATDRAWRSPAESVVLRDADPKTSWKRLHAALWDELVPPRDAADTVQGELIRCIGTLTDEAYRNGNVNWGPRHVARIDWMRATLLDGTFDAAREAEIGALLTRLGHHRALDLSGDGSPHYRVNAAIVEWCLAHRTLIRR